VSVRKPTPAQLSAADPARSVWVTANAGTGKTRVLSDRVLRLLLEGVAPESILCITFTKAAAVEMTERIEKALGEWAVETDDARLGQNLAALRGQPADEATMARARRLFAQVLDLPHGLAIQTIHAFAAGLLRRFPIEAGIPPHFETIDERTAQELTRDAQNRLFGVLREADEDLAKAVDLLGAVMAESTLGDLLREILRERRAIEAALDHHGGLDPLLAALHAELGVVAGTDPVDLMRAACADGEMNEQKLNEATGAMRGGSPTDQSKAATIAAWVKMTPSDRLQAFEPYRAVFVTQKGTERKPLATKAVVDTHPGAFNALIVEQARLLRLDDNVKRAAIAQRTVAMLRVAHALLADYARAKEREAALDFDDLVDKAGLLLQSAEQRQWVLFKLDARIEHILGRRGAGHEPAQWAIVERLVEELAAGRGQHERPRTLFVVGDGKQSIYSFQGADLEGFARVQARIRASLAPDEERLETSFRSAGAILEVVDAVLALPTMLDGVLGGDTTVRHDAFRRNDAGEVIVWPLQKPPEKRGESEPWALPDAKSWQPTAVELLAARLAKAIGERLRAGEVLASTGAPVRPADVLVLVSRRGRVQELIIKALKKRGVPVAGADRLELVGHIAVKDLMALGRALLLPEDDLTFACLPKSPLVGLDDDELFTLAHDRGARSLLEALRAKRASFPEAFARIDDWLRRADFVPPYEFFTAVLAEGGRERMLARLGPDAAEPMEAFLGQALAYEQGHPASLQGFMHWLGLDEGNLKRDSEPARDEVRVMTVHGAKGLEAPFVVLADCGPHQNSERGRILLDEAHHIPYWRASDKERDPTTEKLAAAAKERRAREQCRLLYVAITRAKDVLLVAGWCGDNNETAECWHKLVGSGLVTLAGHEIERDALGRETRRYRAGTLAQGPSSVAAPAPAPPPLPAWARAELTPEVAPTRPLAPSAAGEDDPPSASPQALRAGRSFGIEMHRLLHRLADAPMEVRESMLRQLDAALAPEVRAVLEMPELAAVFAPGSLAEQPIVGRLGDLVISGQIDRMVARDEVVTIVDFKTNRLPPTSVEAVPTVYLRQLAAYAALLERIYPGRRVKAGLVWTAVPRLMYVPAALLQRHRPRSGRSGPDGAPIGGAAGGATEERHPDAPA